MLLVGICSSCADPQNIRHPDGGSKSSAKAPKLMMVSIRASSPGGLKQLRAMPIDIIRVRPESQQPVDKNSLTGGILVEAVVPDNLLPKIRAMGFQVTLMPPKQKTTLQLH